MNEILNWLKEHVEPDADLRLDSRDIQKGDVFVACKGYKGDGYAYVNDAINNGASAILLEGNEGSETLALPHLVVPNLRQKLGLIADAWYGSPSSKITVIAITGTNGKTSCAHWIAQALNASNIPCATIGTLGTVLPSGENLGGQLTTPDVLSVHRILAQLVKRDIEVVSIEASSIGIEQGRLDNVQIKIACFANLTLDHLDYHKSMKEYEEAKTQLFRNELLEHAIINLDDEAGRRIFDSSLAKSNIGYSVKLNPRAQIQASDQEFHDYGLSFHIKMPEGSCQVITRLVGAHNISNLLVLAGVLNCLDFSVEKIVEIIATIKPVSGRLEVVKIHQASKADRSNLPLVVVDYSHTPDALLNALTALRPTTDARKGNLICVFGCGGDRDKTKRPIMAEVASKNSEIVYITSDNPRTEDPCSIINEILLGMDRYAFSHTDRAYSILHAILNAKNEDVILIAGKGHENYQEIQGVKHKFNDAHWASIALLLKAGFKINTDSRTLQQNEIFLALKGDVFDGHDFVNSLNCMGAIVDHKVTDASVKQYIVDDTTEALGIISKAWRSQFNIPIIAVCGSNGKTTCKEMIASILKEQFGEQSFFATQGNLNNHIGVPKSLLSLQSTHKIAVLELGMNHPGEISYLANLVKPTIALVTNAQREHQEFMKTVEAVAKENGSVFEKLDSNGVAIYPNDTAYKNIWTSQSKHCKSITFGDAGVIKAKDINIDENGTSFKVDLDRGHLDINLSILGEHNIQNALAAIAAAVAAQVDLKAIENGLKNFQPVKGRLQKHILKDGVIVVDDTYNANPDSVTAAINILKTLPAPRTLVLGDMGEVGEDGPQMHSEIGRYAKASGIEHLLSIGEASAHAQNSFGNVHAHFSNIEDLIEKLKSLNSKSIIIKGSRFMKMERVLEALTKD